MTKRKDLPWEVQLLLMLGDVDPDSYATCVDSLLGDAESGEMSKVEIRRLVDALRREADYHNCVLVQLKMLVEEPSVKFEDGQWRING
jgi:hypothetical protein